MYESEIFNLDNGITMCIVYSPMNKKNYVSITFGTGFNDDKHFQYNGIAHHVEHLIFKGSEKYPNIGYLSSVVEEYGGKFNAYTSLNTTCYYFHSIDIKKILEVMLESLKNPLLSNHEEEIKIVNSEHEKNINSNVFIQSALFQLFFDNNDYKSFGTGNTSSLKEITKDVLKKFVKENYTTDNMYVCIIINQPLNEIKDELIYYFQSMKKTSCVKRKKNELIISTQHNIIYFNKNLNKKYIYFYIIMDYDNNDFEQVQICDILIKNIINNVLKYSLSYYLIEKGYTSRGLYWSIDEYFNGKFILTSSINYSDKDKHKIINLVYSYIEYLKSLDKNKIKSIYEHFQSTIFLNQVDIETEDFCNMVADNLTKYPQEFSLIKHLYLPDYNDEIYNKYLNIVSTSQLKIITNDYVFTDSKKYDVLNNYNVDYEISNIAFKKVNVKFDYDIIAFFTIDELNNCKKNDGQHKENIHVIKNIYSESRSVVTYIRKNINLIDIKNTLYLKIMHSMVKKILKYYFNFYNDYKTTFSIQVQNNYYMLIFEGYNILLPSFIKFVIKNMTLTNLLKTNFSKKILERTIKSKILSIDTNMSPFEKVYVKINDIYNRMLDEKQYISFLKSITIDKLINEYKKVFGFKSEIINIVGSVYYDDFLHDVESYNIEQIDNTITLFPYNFNFRENNINDTNNAVGVHYIVSHDKIIYKKNEDILNEDILLKNYLICNIICKFLYSRLFNYMRNENNVGYVTRCIQFNKKNYNDFVNSIVYLIQSDKNIDYILEKVNDFNNNIREIINTSTAQKNIQNIKNILSDELTNIKISTESDLADYFNTYYVGLPILYNKKKIKEIIEIITPNDIIKSTLNAFIHQQVIAYGT